MENPKPKTFEIIIPATEDDPKEYRCKLSQPDLGVMKHAYSIMLPMNGDKGDIIGAGEKILASCWIEGDEEIRTGSDPMVRIAAAMRAATLIKSREATIAKI